MGLTYGTIEGRPCIAIVGNPTKKQGVERDNVETPSEDCEAIMSFETIGQARGFTKLLIRILEEGTK